MMGLQEDPLVPWVTYRQEETAVLLQCTQEAEEGDAGDDRAADQQHGGHVEAGQVGDEGDHPERHPHVNPEAQHCCATYLIGDGV